MISAVVCYDKNYGVGFMGDLLFHCPDDMKHFKDVTLYGTVIMGSNTYWSIQNRPLKNRYNIVISRKVDNGSYDETIDAVNNQVSVHTIEEVVWMLERVKERNFYDDRFFVIGGGKTFDSLIDYCDEIYATEVDKEYENVDSYFPGFKETGNWEMEECGEWKEYCGTKYRFCKYVRKSDDCI